MRVPESSETHVGVYDGKIEKKEKGKKWLLDRRNDKPKRCHLSLMFPTLPNTYLKKKYPLPFVGLPDFFNNPTMQAAHF